MDFERIEIVPEQFTPMHLLRLVESVQAIADKSFTKAIADSLHKINNPPMVYNPTRQKVDK